MSKAKQKRYPADYSSGKVFEMICTKFHNIHNILIKTELPILVIIARGITIILHYFKVFEANSEERWNSRIWSNWSDGMVYEVNDRCTECNRSCYNTRFETGPIHQTSFKGTIKSRMAENAGSKTIVCRYCQAHWATRRGFLSFATISSHEVI